jgi:hypothetical protein
MGTNVEMPSKVIFNLHVTIFAIVLLFSLSSQEKRKHIVDSATFFDCLNHFKKIMPWHKIS